LKLRIAEIVACASITLDDATTVAAGRTAMNFSENDGNP
jgi:hypothetical protein